MPADLGLGGCGHLVEFFVDPAGPLAGGGELAGLREWLADAVVGVRDLALGPADAGQGARLFFLQPGQAVFQPGDQPGRVGLAEFLLVQPDAGAGCPVEAEGDGGRAEDAPGRRGDREAAQVTGCRRGHARAVQLGRLPLQQVLEVLPGRGALAVGPAVDGHGELVAAGVLAAADRRVDVAGRAR